MFTQTEKMVTRQVPVTVEGPRVIFSTLAPRVSAAFKPYRYGASKINLRPVEAVIDQFWGEFGNE
jgi:hypothetical protein